MERPGGGGGAQGSPRLKEAWRVREVWRANWRGGEKLHGLGLELGGRWGSGSRSSNCCFLLGRRKGVNDTLELPGPSRRSSLSFMEGTPAVSEVRRPGRQRCCPSAPLAGGFNKKEEEGEARSL